MWLTAIILGAMAIGLCEKLIKHRQEVLSIKLEHERLSSSASASELRALHEEIRELKIRLDEQTILVDDLMRSFPNPDRSVRQRVGGP